MRNWIAADFQVRGNGQVSAFVTGHLQDHERKTKLKDDLQRHQAAESVVIALFRAA